MDVLRGCRWRLLHLSRCVLIFYIYGVRDYHAFGRFNGASSMCVIVRADATVSVLSLV
jgi:hypothetical protein